MLLLVLTKLKLFRITEDLDFGIKYGFLIEELRLLSRGIIIIDKNDIIQYVEYVGEVASHPNYDKALEVLNTL